ncbi:hypothetical protein ANO11243_063810 [Dothideomycetidae sp. 11243]|nr:hypothetical protein ANO11243_063810 [fungal sp. No.11243]
MFAVPGWSVSATSLKTQTEADVRRTENQEGKASRKRKRKSGTSTNVTNENVSSLWEQNIDNKQPGQIQPTQTKGVKDIKSGRDELDSLSTPSKNAGTNGDQIKSAPASKQKALPPFPTDASQPESKKAKKKQKLTDAQQRSGNASAGTVAILPPAPPPEVPSLPPAAKLTPMQQKMREKLVSARFRHLNETLYTAPSATSLSMFADNPSMFEDYHSGFRRQVGVWPENPVDTFIATIEARAKVKAHFNRHGKGKAISEANGGEAVLEALPRSNGTCTLADLGCGDATIARRLNASRIAAKKNLKILSYDLASPNEFITKADVANLPLSNGTVDVAIFCLALMGTNWIDFIEEAYRVLKWKGELWVAEIKSRFTRRDKKGAVVDHSVGKRRKTPIKKKEGKSKAEEEEDEDELRTEVDGEDRKEQTDVDAFVQVLSRRGFTLKKGNESVDLSNKMFVRMEFIKAAPAAVGKNAKQDNTQNAAQSSGGGKKKFVETQEVTREEEGQVLKPCLYKIR